jgi:hypothetical protein
MSDEDWRDDEDQRMDLELENRSLEQEIALRGGILGHGKGDTPPEMLNEFLRHVIEFEDRAAGEQREVRSVFPEGYAFPGADTLSPEELEKKLLDIEEILGDNGIVVDLRPDVPPRLVYGYIVRDVLPARDTFGDAPLSRLVFDGCTGDCPTCFQRAYCDVPGPGDPEPEASSTTAGGSTARRSPDPADRPAPAAALPGSRSSRPGPSSPGRHRPRAPSDRQRSCPCRSRSHPCASW